jgi:hypothetical protein
MANIPAVGAPVVITANHRPTEQGQTPPSLVGHRRQPGESLLCAGARLGLLLYRGTSFCLLISIGLCLLHMRQPLSCKGVSLLRRGSWIAAKGPSSYWQKGWWPLHVRLGRCMFNVTLVAPMSMPSHGTSSTKHEPPVPGLKSSPTLVRHWRNARFFFACRR